MPSDRIQHRIDGLLDEADVAADQRDWAAVAELARDVLALDPDSADAGPLLTMAERRLSVPGHESVSTTAVRTATSS